MGFLVSGHPCRVSAGKSKFQHRFGGPPIHRYDEEKYPELLLHCMYLLDTSDPNLPEIVPGVSTLPLYYGMLNSGLEMAYQIVGENELLFHDIDGALNLEYWNDLGWNAPHETIPEEPVDIIPLTYEEHKTILYAHVLRKNYGMPAISPVDQSVLDELAYPFTQIGGLQPLIQGQPNGMCANPKCQSWSVQIFAIVWNHPTPNFCVWGEYGSDTQIIYEVCLNCRTIHVCNRCS